MNIVVSPTLKDPEPRDSIDRQLKLHGMQHLMACEVSNIEAQGGAQ